MTPAHLDMDKCMTIHLDYELPEYPAFEGATAVPPAVNPI